MRIRYTTLSMVALLLGSVVAGYGARLPKSGSGDSNSTPAAKVATKKAAASSSSGAHSSRTSASKRRAAHAAVAHAQTAPAPSRISEIQSALAREGAYDGTPNGRWDSDTVDAMKHFQTEHDLNPTGKIDALTLQKLGLGSQVSGMGAPIPVAEPQASAAGNNGQATEHP
jgi:peptidoglycan hydrolase-like protein with peptidoglycan-binding domain